MTQTLFNDEVYNLYRPSVQDYLCAAEFLLLSSI